MFFTLAQKVTIQFVNKNFQKSPNLVTLVGSDVVLHSLARLRAKNRSR